MGERATSLPEGWYPVAGDPAGTFRFWNGEQFVGNPEAAPGAVRRSRAVRTDGSARWRMASGFPRAVALLIDLAAPVVIITGMAAALGIDHPGTDLEAWREATDIATAIGVFWIVNRVLLLGTLGRSMGLFLTGLRVVRAQDRNRAPGIVAALVRMLVMFPAVPVSVALFFFGRRRALHDFAARTCVIYG